MSLESFYGGKQGLSSIIKKTFQYISEDDPAYKIAYKNLTDPAKPDGTGGQGKTEEQAKEILKPQTMESCLSDHNYEEVWYGELCLIDSINKNNPANGCLFRRTLAKKGSTYPVNIYGENAKDIGNPLNPLSAEYIGQIVGPQSGTPFVSIGTLNQSDEEARKELQTYNHNFYEKANGETVELIHDETLKENENIYSHEALKENFFVSGNSFNKVLYNWYNIRDNTKGVDTQSWIYLGLQVPYFTADYDFLTTEYYEVPSIHRMDNQPVEWKYQRNKIIGEDDQDAENIIEVSGDGWVSNIEDPVADKTNNFYKHYVVDIPKGVRGNAAGAFRLTTFEKESTIYQSFGVIQKDESANSYKINEEAPKVDLQFIKDHVGELDPVLIEKLDSDTEETEDNILKTVPIYVYDYTIFNDWNNKEFNNKTVTIFIGIPRDVEYFSLAKNGTITVHYKDHSANNLDEQIRWINEVKVNSALSDEYPGYLFVKYNDTYDNITEADIREYLGLGEEDNLPDNLEEIKEILSWTMIPSNLDLPRSVHYNDDTGKVTVATTTGRTYRLKDIYKNEDFVFKYPQDIHLLGDIYFDKQGLPIDEEESRQLQLIYNLKSNGGTNETRYIGDGINYIQKVQISEDKHLLLLFNDSKRWGNEYEYKETVKFDTSNHESEESTGNVWTVEEVRALVTEEKTLAQVKEELLNAGNLIVTPYEDLSYKYIYKWSTADEDTYTQDEDNLKIPNDYFTEIQEITLYKELKPESDDNNIIIIPRKTKWRKIRGCVWYDCGAITNYHNNLGIGIVAKLEKNEDGGYIWTPRGEESINIDGTPDNFISKLRQRYPNGLEIVSSDDDLLPYDMRGMAFVATFFDEKDAINWTYYYAFDYDSHDWRLLEKVPYSAGGVSDTQIEGFNYTEGTASMELTKHGSTFLSFEVGNSWIQTLIAPWKANNKYDLEKSQENESINNGEGE